MKLLALSLLTVVSIVYTGTSQNTNLKLSIARGEEIYSDFCISCHLPNGAGVVNVNPPLANSDYLLKNREASIRGVKFGQKGEIIVNGKKYNNTMDALGLSDNEVADVMNYINNGWGNKNTKMVTETEVSKIKK
jgi:mono/diheme cytochrome c family protein